MNPEEVKYSFPCYQYEESGVWYDKENQSLTAFLGNFSHSYGSTVTAPDKGSAVDDNSVSCVAASSEFPLQDSAPELSEENCSVQFNNNENSEIKTGAQSGTPKVKKTKRKPEVEETLAMIFKRERNAIKKSGGRIQRIPLHQLAESCWPLFNFPRIPNRSLYNSSLRFMVYGFLTLHDLWHVPVSHPMLPWWVQDTIWKYYMEEEREFRTHQQWMSADYFPNHAKHCWLCIDYRGPRWDV